MKKLLVGFLCSLVLVLFGCRADTIEEGVTAEDFFTYNVIPNMDSFEDSSLYFLYEDATDIHSDAKLLEFSLPSTIADVELENAMACVEATRIKELLVQNGYSQDVRINFVIPDGTIVASGENKSSSEIKEIKEKLNEKSAEEGEKEKPIVEQPEQEPEVKEEPQVQEETVSNGDQSAEVKEVIEYYFGADQLESIVSLDDFGSKSVYSVSLYSQIGDIMDTSYLAEQFSALELEYDVEMYLWDGYTIVYDHITQEVTILE